MRMYDIAQVTGLSESLLDKMQAKGTFPKADFLVGEGKIRIWQRTTVEVWLEKNRNPNSD